jgi:ribonuclease Z
MKHKIPCWGYKLSDANKKIVFITDTLPNTNTKILAKDCDILIHEATFVNTMHEKSKKYFHTTEIQAMQIADDSNVKKLILTHFDPSITNEQLKKIIWKNKQCVIFDKKISI